MNMCVVIYLLFVSLLLKKCDCCNFGSKEAKPKTPEEEVKRTTSNTDTWISGTLNDHVYLHSSESYDIKPIFYEPGDSIGYVCNSKQGANNEIQWFQKKDENEKPFGERLLPNEVKIKMTLYRFDNNSKIICRTYHADETLSDIFVSLFLKANYSDPLEDEKLLQPEFINKYLGDTFEIKCSDKAILVSITDNEIIDFPNTNNITVTNNLNNTLYLCVSSETYYESITFIQRKVEKSYKIHVQDIAPPDYFVIGSISTGIIAIIIVIIAIATCIHKKSKKRKENTKLEPEYVEMQKSAANSAEIQYAELDLQTNRKVDKKNKGKKKYNKKINEDCPYVEIIGVIEPKKR